MSFAPILRRAAWVALSAFFLLLATPAAAQTPHGLKTHIRLVNSMNYATTSGDMRIGDGWTTSRPLVTHGVNNISNDLGMYSNSDFTATADYGVLSFQGFGSGQSVPYNGLFLRIEDWIGAEPRAQYNDRLYVTSNTLPQGTPVFLEFHVSLTGSTTIVDTNPLAQVWARLTANHSGPISTLLLSLDATPSSTTGVLESAVGDSINVNGRLGVYLYANGMLGGGNKTGSIAADVTAYFQAFSLTEGAEIRMSSNAVVVAAPATPRSVATLEAARPNPFNPSTTLPLVLTEASQVELTVFDVRGRRVRRLYEGWLAEGRHEFTWDGRDDRGSMQSSGAYFARARTDLANPTTRTLILVK
jgi:hypothetical protein